MRSACFVLAACLLLVVSQAMAQSQPTITSPEEGATLGPNYDVIGSMPSRALVVVMTDVLDCDTNEVIGSVPGIRHWTRDDGSFHFRVASPRISIGEKDTDVSYRVRVFEVSPGQQGPEQVVSAQCVSPTLAQAMSIVPVSMTENGGAKPTITAPQEGAELGPNYEVIGSMPERAFVVVMTDVVDTETGEVVRTVPGIRHWTRADGSFHFRVASPRVAIGDQERELSYRVRVFEAGPQDRGPETIVNASMAQ